MAGGDGRLSIGLLLKNYRLVDLFDQCPKAVKIARQCMRKTGKLGYVEQATMQAFQWKYRYSGIFMVWCTGYLARPELVAFFERCVLPAVPEVATWA